MMTTLGPTKKPYVGAQVLYVLESGNCKGDFRPAFVVRDWKQPGGLVNMQVLTDGFNDTFRESVAGMQSNGEAVSLNFSANTLWRTSVHYSEDKEPGTWHWSEEAEVSS